MNLSSITFHLEYDREKDGRSIAEIHELPGVLAYGDTRETARNGAIALALRVVADRIEHGEPVAKGHAPQSLKTLSFA